MSSLLSVLLPFGAAPYFEKCISEQDLDEVHIEIIRNTLYKVTDTSGPSLQRTPDSPCSIRSLHPPFIYLPYHALRTHHLFTSLPLTPSPPSHCSLTRTQAYLEDFHRYCKELGGTTAEVMCPLLEVKGQSHSLCVS